MLGRDSGESGSSTGFSHGSDKGRTKAQAINQQSGWVKFRRRFTFWMTEQRRYAMGLTGMKRIFFRLPSTRTVIEECHDDGAVAACPRA